MQPKLFWLLAQCFNALKARYKSHDKVVKMVKSAEKYDFIMRLIPCFQGVKTLR